MMARHICIRLKDPPPITDLEMVVPGMGVIQTLRDFTMEGYNVCADARAWLQGFQPFLMGLGLPLCLLRCANALVGVFDPGSATGIDFSAIPAIIEECGCLTGFTPFGFCDVLLALVRAVQILLSCIVGLMGDLIQLYAQIVALLTDPSDAAQFTAQCLLGNYNSLMAATKEAFKAVDTLLQSTSFLFDFVGVPFISLGDLGTGGAAEVIEVIQTVLLPTLSTIADAIGMVCP